MLTYPWKCTVLHCNHLGNTWKPLVLMTRHFDYCPSASECDNQSVRSSAPVVSRCFPGGYNVKLYISRGRLAWWLLTFLHSQVCTLDLIFLDVSSYMIINSFIMYWLIESYVLFFVAQSARGSDRTIFWLIYRYCHRTAHSHTVMTPWILYVTCRCLIPMVVSLE